VGGIQVVLASVPVNPRGTHTAVTNEDGLFTIDHVQPQSDHQLFVPMDSVAAKNLAALVQSFRTGHEGQPTDVAEINLHPACTVRGKIAMSKGESPRGLAAIIGRTVVGGDSQTAPLGEDGTFVFQGVPKESVMLWITERGGASRTFRPSSKNHSLDPVQRNHLCGRVDEDLDLTVLLDPITAPERTLRQAEDLAIQSQVVQAQRAQALAQARQAQAIAQAQRVGVQARNPQLLLQNNGQLIMQNAPYAPSDERTARRMQLQSEPLRGITESPEQVPAAPKQP
jgi:hypothetical protein